MSVLDPYSDLVNLEMYVIACGIAMARMTGFAFVFPAFTRLQLSGIIRAGVAIALSLPLIPYIAGTVVAEKIPTLQMMFFLLKEVIVGAVLGLFLGAPLWAAEVAGEILDVQRGAMFGDITDQGSGDSNNVTGNFFIMLIIAMFFASGGLSIVLNTIYNSYDIWPIKSTLPIFNEQSGGMFLVLLDDILGLGLLLVAPISIAFLLTDFSLAIVAKAVPQMNVFMLSLAVKNFIFVLLLVLYGVFLLGYMGDNLSLLLEVESKLERVSNSR